jgi:3-methyladenine DNA glycosylase AlkD
MAKAAPAPVDVETVIAELRALGSAENRAGMARFGINTARAFGVPMTAQRPLARKYRRNHGLALALWASGYHEARILAALIDDPATVTPRQMDAWAADFNSWDLCDQVCLKLFVKTPYTEAKIVRWAKDRREFVRRAAFALMAAYSVHGKDADEALLRFLPLIEAAATDERNFVRKAVNWALRQVGKQNSRLHAPALKLARQLAASDNRAARWIGNDAVRELTDPIQVARIAARDAKTKPQGGKRAAATR